MHTFIDLIHLTPIFEHSKLLISENEFNQIEALYYGISTLLFMDYGYDFYGWHKFYGTPLPTENPQQKK